MRISLPDEALNQIFGEARTHSAWLDKPERRPPFCILDRPFQKEYK